MAEIIGAQACCPIEIDFSNLSQFCSLQPRPLLTTGLLIQWLRRHFGNPAMIEDELLANYYWTSSIDTTKIVIDSVFKWEPSITEARPAVLVKRGAWKVLQLGIDNRRMPTTKWHCTTRYNVMIQGSHTVFCLAGESGEVELLATEVSRELIQFGPKARSSFGFLRFGVSDIGDVNILAESKEHFVVPITVSYGLQDTWTICPDDLPAGTDFKLE